MKKSSRHNGDNRSAIWQYHRFNQSYRDVREQLLYRGIDVSHETIRSWCYKFGKDFEEVEVTPKNQTNIRETFLI